MEETTSFKFVDLENEEDEERMEVGGKKSEEEEETNLTKPETRRRRRRTLKVTPNLQANRRKQLFKETVDKNRFELLRDFGNELK